MISYRHSTSPAGFSMLEMVLVVSIIGIVAAIAAPRFSGAADGRRISAAGKALTVDIEVTRKLARAKSKAHTIAFYPDDNMYVVFEGTDIRRDAIVFARDFDRPPYELDLKRTSLGNNAFVVVTPLGDLSDSFTVGLSSGGTEVPYAFEGLDEEPVSVTESEDGVQINAGIIGLGINGQGVNANVGGGLGLNLNLGLGKGKGN